MVGVGSFLTLGLVALGLIVITRFGPGFGRGAAGIGTGLGALGTGIRGFVSQVASPTVSPGFFPRLDVSGVLPGLQALLDPLGPIAEAAADPDPVLYPPFGLPDQGPRERPPPPTEPRDEFDDPISDGSGTPPRPTPSAIIAPLADYEYDFEYL